MLIEVQGDEWGDVRLRDLSSVLHDAASHTNRLVGEPVTDHIVVIRAPEHNFTPLTHYRSPRGVGPITIQLTSQNRRWAQYSYQFAHEFCHVLTNYERLEGNPNEWFYEALCELASVFTIRRMAETWKTASPVSGNEWYTQSLAEYADAMLNDPNRQLPPDHTLAQWRRSLEDTFRLNLHRYHPDAAIRDLARHRYAIVAYSLLQLFEGDPGTWDAVRYLPVTGGRLDEYLLDWYREVPSERRAAVGCMIELLTG